MKDQLEALVLQMYKSNILYSEGVREFKKRFILTVLQENKGNQCRAARELGMHRNTLSRTIDEFKIDVRQLRDGAKRPPRSARPMSFDRERKRCANARGPCVVAVLRVAQSKNSSPQRSLRTSAQTAKKRPSLVHYAGRRHLLFLRLKTKAALAGCLCVRNDGHSSTRVCDAPEPFGWAADLCPWSS